MSPHDAAVLRDALDQALRESETRRGPVTVAAVLIAYAICVGTLGSRLLGRARWTARAPLLAIVTYLAAGWSVVAALGLAGLTLAVHATALGGGLSHLIGACVLRLRETYGTPGGATVAALGLTLAGAVAARTVAHRHDPPARRRAAGAAARGDRAARRPSRAFPGRRARGALRAGCLLRCRPASDGDPEHRRARKRSNPLSCRRYWRTSELTSPAAITCCWPWPGSAAWCFRSCP